MMYCKNFFCLLLLLSLSVYGQTSSGIIIKGLITDENTKEPIVSATVFLENTTIGTTSNSKGEFEIKNAPLGTYNLVISSIGYELKTNQIRAYQPEEFMFNVKLKQKVIVLGDVNVVAKKDEDWQDNIEIFKRELLGQSKNSDLTRILNPEVVNFRKDEETNLLHAYTDSTIIVENKALGYKLYIMLISFSFNARSKLVKYLTHVRFVELTPENESEKEEWYKRREKSYIGSEKHFFSALVNKRLNEEGFRIMKKDFYQMLPEDLNIEYMEDLDLVRANIPGPLWIECIWDGNRSLLKPLDSYILLDRFGNYMEESQTEIFGYWAHLRISDTLPFDYILVRK